MAYQNALIGKPEVRSMKYGIAQAALAASGPKDLHRLAHLSAVEDGSIEDAARVKFHVSEDVFMAVCKQDFYAANGPVKEIAGIVGDLIHTGDYVVVNLHDTDKVTEEASRQIEQIREF